jgi:hypothetical protein
MNQLGSKHLMATGQLSTWQPAAAVRPSQLVHAALVVTRLQLAGFRQYRAGN